MVHVKNPLFAALFPAAALAGVVSAPRTSSAAYQWGMQVSVSDGTCLLFIPASGFYLYDEEACDMSSVYQFFDYSFPNGPLQQADNNCVDLVPGASGAQAVGSEPCNGSSSQVWSQDSNGEFHNGANGQCLDGGYVFYEQWCGCYIGVASTQGCDGGNNAEKFFTPGPYGRNPFPYVADTIKPYFPAEPNFVLDVYENGRANGTPVDIAPFNATSAQFWTFDPNTFEYHLAADPSFCLDKPGGQNANGTLLEIWQCNGGDNQKWLPFGNEVVNFESGTCLDAPLMDFNNPRIEVWTCNGGLNQGWQGPHS